MGSELPIRRLRLESGHLELWRAHVGAGGPQPSREQVRHRLLSDLYRLALLPTLSHLFPRRLPPHHVSYNTKDN